MTVLACDSEGFLLEMSDWSPAAAEQLAASEAIELTDAHWEVLHLLREYYLRYNLSPPARVLVKITAESLGADKGRSIYLMQLFGGKPAKLAAKLAGLPKPANCD